MVPMGFTTENLETVYEIDLEYIRDIAAKKYEQVERVDCPNAHSDFNAVLADVVYQNLHHGKYKTANLRLRCPGCKFSICNNLGTV